MLRRAAGVLAGTSSARRTLAVAPNLRGRGVALLWHRVRPVAAEGDVHVVLTVSTELFQRQLEAVARTFDIVPLATLDDRDPGSRPRVALTFDDDDPGHAEHALPILEKLGLPATFFLSGRWLHGLGPYWWEVLEEETAVAGVEAVAAHHGVRADSVGALARQLEGTSTASGFAARGDRSPGVRSMRQDHATQLVRAGMEIGFHTVHHPVLPNLSTPSITAAVKEGRRELEGALGTSVLRFAYPHGRHDERVRDAVRANGYVSGWSTSEQPTSASDEAAARGRWEAGPRSPEAVLAGLARRLLRSAR
jgi:peptidoglycan/xylan/chitin deacetylase (PgdA/CDA1 family)